MRVEHVIPQQVSGIMCGMNPLCACGCGQEVGIARQTKEKYGYVKGQPYKFKGGHQRRLLTSKSYPVVKVGNTVRGRHILRAEAVLGRRLRKGEQVHHADGSKNADGPLVICPSPAYHQFLHIRMRVKAAGGDPNTQRVCCNCKELKAIDAFMKSHKNAYCERQGMCKECFNKGRRNGLPVGRRPRGFVVPPDASKIWNKERAKAT